MANMVFVGDPKTNLPVKDTITDVKTLNSALKVVSTITLGDFKQLVQKDALVFNEVVGGTATSVYENAHGGVKMTVNASGDYVVRESRIVFNYTAGNPQVVELTAIDLTPVVNVIKRVGYGSRTTVAPHATGIDGFCFETDNTDLWVKVYKGGSVLYEARQDKWDDPMLTTSGRSGLILDKSKFQAMVIDFLYLGGTCVRFGFIIGETVNWVHTFKNSNIGASTFVLSPNQPVFWDIRSSGAAVASLYHICCRVASLGDINNIGYVRHHNNAAAFTNANTVGTKYALIGVQQTNRNYVTEVVSFSAMALTADKYLVELIVNPTVAGVFTYNAVANSGYSIALGDSVGNPSTNTVTGGIVIDGGYASSGQDMAEHTSNFLRIGRTIAGVYDTIVVVVTPLTVNLDILGGVEVRELI